MAKQPGSKASRISAEERQLEQQRADLLRKQQELEKRLKRLPVELEAQEEQQRAATKRRAAAAGPALSPNFGRSGSRRGRSKGRTFRMPSREMWITRLKTFGWLFILAVIVFMLWKVIPSH